MALAKLSGSYAKSGTGTVIKLRGPLSSIEHRDGRSTYEHKLIDSIEGEFAL